MITLFFAANRRIEQQGYTKENKSKKKYARKEIFLQSTKKSLKPTKTLDRVSAETDPQIK